MSLTDRLQQLIELYENQIKQYESRIEKMEKDINKNRFGLRNIIPRFVALHSLMGELKRSYSQKRSKGYQLVSVFYPF